MSQPLSDTMTLSDILSLVALVIAVLAALSSYFAAKKFGDVAGTNAAIRYEEGKATRARLIALQALLNQVAVIREMAHHNSKLQVGPGVITTESAIRMPVTTLETALLSRESVLLDESKNYSNSELFSSIAEYLAEAHSTNALVDLRLAMTISEGTGMARNALPDVIQKIRDSSERLPKILDRLEDCLTAELDSQIAATMENQ